MLENTGQVCALPQRQRHHTDLLTGPLLRLDSNDDPLPPTQQAGIRRVNVVHGHKGPPSSRTQQKGS